MIVILCGGYHRAADGAKGWEAIASASPPIGLVISGWNMPNSTGLDMARPVLMVPSVNSVHHGDRRGEQHQIMEALKAGVSNCVIKPFTPAGLKRKAQTVHKKLTA